jgi:hypothetical protein
MPSTVSTIWNESGTYTGRFTTAEIIADLADAINTFTLVSKTTNILAAPQLAAAGSLHKIDFQARLKDLNVAVDIITVRIQYTDDSSTKLPFQWGPTKDILSDETINSVLLTVQAGKTTTTAISSSSALTGDPTVLYFKRATTDESGNVFDYQGTQLESAAWQSTTQIRFRVTPDLDTEVSADVTRLVDADPARQLKLDNERPGQVAEILLNELFKVKADTRALGALIRNDNPGSSDALVGLELVAYSLANPETWVILDVLELPPDIVMATGNLQAPLTPFSNKPRSVRVEARIFAVGQLDAAIAKETSISDPALVRSPKIIKQPVSEGMRYALQKGRMWEEQRFKNNSIGF